MAIGDYRMKLTNIHDVEGGNWKAEEGVFQVFEDETLITELRPQKRISMPPKRRRPNPRSMLSIWDISF